jgi:hypothetical protein
MFGTAEKAFHGEVSLIGLGGAWRNPYGGSAFRASHAAWDLMDGRLKGAAQGPPLSGQISRHTS